MFSVAVSKFFESIIPIQYTILPNSRQVLSFYLIFMYDIQPLSAALYGKAAVYNFVHSFYGKKPKPLVRSCKKTHLSLQKPKRS